MKPWELENIRRATKSKWLQRGGRALSGRICTDSRKAAEGDLFVAIHGKNHDAHDFIGQVVGANVAAVLVHREPPAEILAAAQTRAVAVLLTDDTVAGLNRLAAAYRAELRAKVIAVGGSNGKTTTKRIIHTLLAEKFGDSGGHASPRSFNNNIGMPLTLLEVHPSHEFVVLEIGTNAPGEIAALGEVAKPDIAVITNVGLEHLEQLGDLAGVAREEAAIAAFVQPGGTLVIPADAPELLASLKRSTAQRITIGSAASNADLQATDVRETIHGVTFTVNGRGGFRMPLLGAHNALNALFAVAVARRMGLSDEAIQAGLEKVQPAPMRMEVVRLPDYVIINDAYNANPSSMAVALQTFARLTLPAEPGAAMSTGSVRRVAILGDMLELGAASPAMHQNIGTLVAAQRIDVLIAIGRAMRQTADAARAAGVTVHCFADAPAAAPAIGALLQPGDAVLLKGSRGMGLEKVLQALPQPVPASNAGKCQPA